MVRTMLPRAGTSTCKVNVILSAYCCTHYLHIDLCVGKNMQLCTYHRAIQEENIVKLFQTDHFYSFLFNKTTIWKDIFVYYSCSSFFSYKYQSLVL